MEPKPLWGFYSQKHAEKAGYAIYKTLAGDKVKVTAVYESMDEYSDTGTYNYSDAIAVGKVTEWVAIIDLPETFMHIDRRPIDIPKPMNYEDIMLLPMQFDSKCKK